ncbi:MAG: hypothetical protein L6R42_006389 [Xanthoria sp. 1 TBL-2021]|nr:MAG: hypothetical protein L6R42_006389 [Xanthoria sp. 1 TBL-2021]
MPPPPAKLLASQLIKNSSKAGINLAIEYATKTTAWNRTFCSPQLQADFAAVAEEAKFNSDILDDTIKDKDGNELPTKHLVRDKATGKVEEEEK